MDTCSNIAQLPAACPPEAPAKPKRRRPYKAIKPRPFTREQLDQRTAAFKMFDSLYAAVASDCGGMDQISAVQRELIEAFCGVAIRLNDLNTRGLAGQPVNLSDLSLAASTLTRLASRIGIARRAKELTPSVDQYVRDYHEAAE
jgi:hypothetical protein